MAKAYALVATPNMIYVLLDERAEFDKIARPATDHGVRPDGIHMISKTVEQDGVIVIFQYSAQ